MVHAHGCIYRLFRRGMSKITHVGDEHPLADNLGYRKPESGGIKAHQNGKLATAKL